MRGLTILIAGFALTAFSAAALTGCADVTRAWNDLARMMEEASAIEQPANQREISAETTAHKEGEKVAVFVTAAGTSELSPAARHMMNLSRETLAVLGDGALTTEQREAYFRKRLARDLDVPLIARFTIGSYWRDADAAQKEAYLKVFMDFVVQIYSKRLGGADISRLDILATKRLGKKDVLVRTSVVTRSGNPVRADWRLRQTEGGFQIIDLSVEGISMAVMLRQDFTSVIRRKGLDGLVAILKQRLS